MRVQDIMVSEEEKKALFERYKSSLIELKDGITECADLREAVIGLEVKNPEAYKEAQKIRSQLRPLASMHKLNGEQRTVAVFATLAHTKCDLITDVIGDDYDSEDIFHEYKVGNGRVDCAIFHNSNTLSLIEIKDCTSHRDIVAGIGQVLWYAAMAERTTDRTRINPVLAVLGDHDDDIERACSLAGVHYICLGPLKNMLLLSKIMAATLGS